MANGLITLSGTGSELLQRLEIRALPIWKAAARLAFHVALPLSGSSRYTSGTRRDPHRAMLRFCAGARYLSFCWYLWLWAPVFAGATDRAATCCQGYWICPKFADDFAAKLADNGPGFGTRCAGCFP